MSIIFLVKCKYKGKCSSEDNLNCLSCSENENNKEDHYKPIKKDFYKPCKPYIWTPGRYEWWDTKNQSITYVTDGTGCLHDLIDGKIKIDGISCPCPKCSPQCTTTNTGYTITC